MDARQFGPYQLKALIGAGGMGEVFHAYDTRRHRSVAVKLLPEKFSNDRAYQRRFRRESHLAARLREPHIIPIHDFGEIEGRLFIDMRLVDGESISSILEKNGAMAPARAIHLIGQVAEALAVAHADGLVHRDIKPSNVLVTETDFVYVIDFGIAYTMRTDSTALTKSGTTVGTLDYMAPERFKSRHIDSRVDVYSLTCLLYECLTASQPFPGHDLPALMYAHVFHPPPQPSKIDSNVPEALDAVIAKGMAKEPDARFDTAGGLAEAAKAALAADPPHRDADHSPAGSAGNMGNADNAGNVVEMTSTPDDQASRPANRAAGQRPAELGPGTRQATPTNASTRANSTRPTGSPDDPKIIAAVSDASEKKITINAGAPPPALSGTSSGNSGSTSTRRRNKKKILACGTAFVIAVLVLSFFLSDRLLNRYSSLSSGASAATPTIGAKIPVGTDPGFIAVAPDGRHAYTANRGDRSLSVIDTTRKAVTATIPVAPGGPQFIAFTPDGSRAYLSIYDDDRNARVVGVLNTTSNSIVSTVRVGASPFAIEVSPDGKSVYVADHDSGIVSVLETATNKILTTISVPPNPHSIKISHDGNRAYVASHESNQVSVIDTATNRVTTTIPVGAGPHSLAITPDQSKVADVNYDGNTVSVIDTATNRVTSTIPVGTHPHDIDFSPDGQHAYVANKDSNTVSVIDLSTNQVTATIPTEKGPARVAVLPNGQHVYVANVDSGDVTVLDTAAQHR